MAKKNTNTQGMTCEQMKTKLKELVDAHNESNDVAERQKLGTQALKLKDDYNKVSLLDVYAEAMEAENPMLAFIKAYTYPTISVGRVRVKLYQGSRSRLFACIRPCRMAR